MIELPSIQQLENFIIYGKVRNFATAAHRANITQSAFSFQMKKLEEMLNIQLITRSNRGSDLTREGEFFLQKIIPIIDELDEAIDELQKFAGKAVYINIGALMSMGEILMNRHISYFKQHNDNNICFNVYNLEAKSMLKKLDSGQIDIASTFLLPQMHVDGCEKKLFCKDEFVYYAPCLDFTQDKITADIIQRYPLVTHSPDYFMTNALEDYFVKLKIHPHIDARLSTPYAIIHYCKHNKVATLISKRLLQELGITNDYYELLEPLNFSSYLLYKHENPKIKSMEIFVDYILDLYQQNR